MKKTVFRRIITFVLILAMLSGQVMTAAAFAGDVPFFSEGAIQSLASQETIPQDKTEAVSPVEEADEVSVEPIPQMVEAVQMTASAPFKAAAANDGGISIDVSSTQTTVNDGENYTFTVSVKDSDLNTLPNIQQGTRLVIEFPEFLTADNMTKVLNDASAFRFFEDNYTYDKNTHKLTLTFKDNPDGTWIAYSFNMSMEVDTIGYDGDGNGQVKVGLGGTDSGTASGTANIGVGTGTGESTPTDEPYMNKYVWSNYKESQYSISKYDVARDPNQPIGYAIAMGINGNYQNSVTVIDDLSGGNLTLCDKSGNTNTALNNCFQILVGGTLLNGTMSGNQVVFNHGVLGTITVEKNGTGFKATMNRTNGASASQDGEVYDVVLRYFAKLTGDANSITNTASLTIDNTYSDTKSHTMAKYEEHGLSASKNVMDGNTPVTTLKLDDETAQVTFRINLTQYGDGNSLSDGEEFIFDVLEDCFTYVSDSVTSNCRQYFKLISKTIDGRKTIVIAKDGDAPIPTGEYYIDFKVNIDTSKLKNGEQATNFVGNTVVVRRPAKITINKTWAGDKNKGSGAEFALYNGNTLIADSGEMSTGDSFTLYFWADQIADGTKTYTLKETVDANSGYVASPDIPIKIKNDGGKITIVSVNNQTINSGAANVAVTNKPDSGKGTLTFKKYANSVSDANLLDGGIYELYRVSDGIDEFVERFSTVEGTKTFTDLPYGTYYVKEVSAPTGYTIQGNGTTAQVKLEKIAPNQSVNLVNKLYKDGSIEILKKDENGRALAGVTFTLTQNGSIKTQKTNSNGKASFTGLAAGDYTITETLPTGYSGFAGPLVVTIDEKGEAQTITAASNVTSVSGNKITINWNNTQLFGSIKVTKYGETAATKLNGAVFELSGNGIQTRTATTVDGELTFDNLPYGTYTLKEKTAPAGYVISDNLANGVQVTIDSTTQVSLSYTNAQQTGSITITKKETGTQQVLSGATFGVYTSESATEPIATKTTGTDGKCTFNDLKSGIYYVKEISAPTGYQLSTQVLTFKMGVVEGVTNYVWTHSSDFENAKKLYDLKLVKADENGNIKLAGAEFLLTGDGIADKTATSAADGSVVFTDIPFGTYTVTETKAPAGYVPAAQFQVTVNGSNTPAVYAAHQTVDGGIVNNTHTKLSVLKVDDQNETKGLPGATFVIKQGDNYVTATGDNGAYIYSDLVNTADAATKFVTGSAGTFTLEYIPMGSYVLKEAAAPGGYIIATESKDFTIQHAAESVTVGNTQIKASLKLVKTDEHGKLLPDIGFTLKTAEGYVQVTGENGSYAYAGIGDAPSKMYTAENGVIQVSGLLWGTYTITEDSSTTPVGLIPAEDSQFAVTAAEHNKTIPVSVENKRLVGDISLYKADTSGNALPGAMFRAECITSTAYSDTEIRYAVSDADGKVTFKNLPYGVYKVTEYLAPYGKVLSDEVYYISVGGAKAPEGIALTNGAVTCVNADKLLMTTFKKLSTSGEPLTGAVFEIQDEDGNVVETLTLNDPSGTAEVELPVGAYELVEVKAPDNYVKLDKPVHFTVTEARPNTVTVENAPFTGTLSIHKTGESDKALAGAEFAVYDKADYETNGANADVLYSLVTNSDGEAHVDGVLFGDYAVVETKAPEGYELNTEPQYFTIDQEKQLPSAELTFVNEKSRYVFELFKTDINSQDKLLPGAEFLVYGEGLYTKVKTGDDGKVLVEVPKPGTYHIVEIGMPVGYTIDPNVYTVDVTGHTPVGAAVGAAFTSEDYPAAVRLTKVNENDEPMDGAVFELYAVDGDTRTLVRVSGTDGAYTYDPESQTTQISAGNALVKYLPAGRYMLHEVTAPAGYMTLSDMYFTLDGSEFNKPVEITAANLPYQRGVAVCKENEDGIRLKGAEFTLYDADGEVIAEKETTASGYAVFPNLRTGSYAIKETKAPVGYQPDETVYRFTIGDDGQLTGDGFVSYGTQENPFFVLTVTDKPICHDFTIAKTSAMNGALLDGAQFRIIGSGVNQVFTVVNGYANVTNLPVGEYMLTEVKAPKGYVASAQSYFVVVSPDNITIDGVALDSTDMTFTVANEPMPFDFTIEKTDEDTKQPLAGAAFTVIAPDGSRYYLVTDANGRSDSITLMPGTYAVTESVAPKGYDVPLAGWSFTVEEGTLRVVKNSGIANFGFDDGTLTLQLTNKRTTGNLLIYKYDAENEKTPLAGAKFKVLDKDGNTLWFTLENGVYHAVAANTPDAGNRLTTNAMGRILVEDVETGTYTLREVKAPTGYKLDKTDIQVKLTELDETIEVKVANEMLRKPVTVIKQSAGDNPQNLMGAVFALYTVEDGKPGNLVAEGTTQYDGTTRFEVPYGDYMIVETRAPEGYELSTQEPVVFHYNDQTPEDEAFVFTFANEKTYYSIEAYKFDERDNRPLQGAKFAFTDSRGFTKTIETGEDGYARLEDAAYDDYTVREIFAPEGYYLNEQEYVVHKEELKHNQAVHFDVPDTFILGSVDLKKVDFEDNTKVLDAEFVITDAQGNELYWQSVEGGYVYTGAEAEGSEKVIHAGTVKLSDIPAGDYTITEVKAPDGYLKLDESRGFSITADNAKAGIEITIENLIRKTAVGIIKADSLDTQKRIEGAEFTLYSIADGQMSDAISVAVTDKSGIVVFTDLTMGEYCIMETKAPYGYKLWSTPVNVSVDAEGIVRIGDKEIADVDAVHMVGLTNENILKDFTIRKVSSGSSQTLPGAVFKISSDDRTWYEVSNENGEVALQLPYGQYVIEEITAPEGYVLGTTKYLVSVSEKGIVVNGKAVKGAVLAVENDAIQYPLSLHKQDAFSGKPLGNAKFTIEGKDIRVSLTTNASGNSDTVYLAPGEYTLTESKAPMGYQKISDSWKLVVHNDGTMQITGDSAVITVAARSCIATVENKPLQPSPFVKTGQPVNKSLLLTGSTLMLTSFAGLMILVVNESKRRRKAREW